MSAESAAAPERDRADLPDHLTRDGSEDAVTSLQFLRGEREAYCRECGWRVTIGQTGQEYGHRRNPKNERCSHRSAKVDPVDVRSETTPSEQAMLDWLAQD